MTADLRPYPDYKDTGVKWLGQVPAHWDCLPHRALFQEIKDQGHFDEPLLSVTISKGIIQQSDLLAESSKKDSSNLDKSKYKLVVPGDIAYNKMRAWQGAVGVSRHRGIVSPAYIVVRLRNSNNPEYFHFLFRTPGFATEAERWSYGITSDQWSLRPEHFKMIYSCVPLRPEQDAIVAFLRHADARVRRFIRNQRRLIELLNEQKQAIITRSVTRGLNPNVPLKTSGIDWFGDIPVRWRAIRLKYVSHVQTGITLGKNYNGQQLEERPYLRVANVQTGRLDLRIVKTVAVPPSEILSSELKPGDVLMTEGGDIDKLGRGCVWQGEIEGCLHQNHIFAVRADQSRLLPDYLVALMASHLGRVYFQLTAKQTTNLASTNSSTLGAFPLVLPEVNEQRQILEAIKKETLPIDAAIEHTQREIDLIREYRTRLIADVVTGKVDVRQLVSDTPAKTASVAVNKQVEAGRAANIYFKRSVFAAEIVHRLHDEPTFGHVKFEKLIFLCEKQCGVDTGSVYYRQAAGPYDNRALRSIDSQMEKQRWYAVQKDDKRYRYVPMAKSGGHKIYFDRHFAGIEDEFTRLIEMFRKFKTEQCEIIATLYSAWGDLLDSSEQVTENRIIEQVLHHWHTSKQRIDEGRWQRALGWMKEKGLVPRMTGSAEAEDLECLETDEYIDEEMPEDDDEVAEEVTDADD